MKIKFNKAPQSPDEVNGLKVNYAPTQRPFAAWRFKIVLVLFLSPFLFYVLYIAKGIFIVTEPGFIRLEEYQVKTSVEANVVRILPVDTVVEVGDIVAVLENKLLQMQYHKYHDRVKGDFYEEHLIKSRHSELLKLSRKMYEYHKKQYVKMLALEKEGAVREDEVAAVYEKLLSAKSSYLKEKKSLEGGDNSAQVDFINEMKMKELAKQINNLVIKAPYSGVIISNNVKEYDKVVEHQMLMNIEMKTKPRIEVYLEPNNAKYAVIKQSVKVIFPGNLSIDGVVSNINMKAVRTPNGLTSGFSKNSFAIVLEISLNKNIPENFAINYLPIEVRFDFLENLFQKEG